MINNKREKKFRNTFDNVENRPAIFVDGTISYIVLLKV